MLGNLLMAFRNTAPDFPGRQRLLSLCDRVLGPFRATTGEGVRLRVRVSSFMDAIYFQRGAQAAGDKRLLETELSRLAPGDVFVDVGANIGYYALLAARRVGAGGLVLAFEPSQREFARLLENIAVNSAVNVVPVSVALAGSPGILTLHIAPTHTGLNTLSISASAANALRDGAEQRVAVAVFDSVGAAILGERRVKLLKIDVEGAEYEVLAGMEASLARGLFETIVVEITPEFLRTFGRTKEQLYALLARHGYQPQIGGEEWQYDEVFRRG